MSRTDCTCTVSNVPKTRDPSAIGQQSSLVTDLAQIHRLTLCIITVASSSEDGPGTIRNFEKLFPLFWKKRQENTGLLPGTKITMSIKPHVRTYGASESSLDRGKWRKEQEKRGEKPIRDRIYVRARTCIPWRPIESVRVEKGNKRRERKRIG